MALLHQVLTESKQLLDGVEHFFLQLYGIVVYIYQFLREEICEIAYFWQRG